MIVTPQYSLNKIDWNDLTSDAQTLSADGTTLDTFANGQLYVRFKLVSSGSASLTLDIRAIPGSGEGSSLPPGAATETTLAAAAASLASLVTYLLSKYITGIGHGNKTVTTAGTPVALAANTPCKKVIVEARGVNTGRIAVGTTGVSANPTTGSGITLGPTDSVEIEIDNLSKIYIDSSVSAEGVFFTYFT